MTLRYGSWLPSACEIRRSARLGPFGVRLPVAADLGVLALGWYASEVCRAFRQGLDRAVVQALPVSSAGRGGGVIRWWRRPVGCSARGPGAPRRWPRPGRPRPGEGDLPARHAAGRDQPDRAGLRGRDGPVRAVAGNRDYRRRGGRDGGQASTPPVTTARAVAIRRSLALALRRAARLVLDVNMFGYCYGISPGVPASPAGSPTRPGRDSGRVTPLHAAAAGGVGLPTGARTGGGLDQSFGQGQAGIDAHSFRAAFVTLAVRTIAGRGAGDGRRAPRPG